VANLTFTTNFEHIVGPTQHLWSLGVEEQFYIIWPCIVFFLLQRKTGPVKLLFPLMVPILVAPIIRMLDCKQWYPESLQNFFHSSSFFAVFDWLAYGSAAAVLFFYWPTWLKTFFDKKFKRVAILGLFLVFVPSLESDLHVPGRIRALSAESLQAIGFSLLLLQSILKADTKTYHVLNLKWIKHLGILSYSIYVWHGMFCSKQETVFGANAAWCGRFPMWIFMSILVAHASYYLLEKPLMGLRTKFRNA
jgi:peptidoglycan/LPS O-acetylase OafA/YrhL